MQGLSIVPGRLLLAGGLNLRPDDRAGRAGAGTLTPSPITLTLSVIGDFTLLRPVRCIELPAAPQALDHDVPHLPPPATTCPVCSSCLLPVAAPRSVSSPGRSHPAAFSRRMRSDDARLLYSGSVRRAPASAAVQRRYMLKHGKALIELGWRLGVVDEWLDGSEGIVALAA